MLAALTDDNRLVVEVMEATGLRVGDVLALTRDQVRQGRVTIREQKTGKSRRVTIPARLARQILQRPTRSPWAFPGRDETRHRTRQAVWADVKRAARAFRLPANISPHSVRKLYAVDLLQRYGDLERVRRALNHDDVAVTLIYAMADRLARKRVDRRR